MRFIKPVVTLAFTAWAYSLLAEPVASTDIYMVDGDTADVGDDRYRLVGYDTPETYKPKCDFEKALGTEATRRARQLVQEAGTVDFVILPGRDKYGRGLARVFLHGEDLGSILIAEGLARPYAGGRRKSWCK